LSNPRDNFRRLARHRRRHPRRHTHAQIEALVRNMSAEGLFVIANETVDVSDGGVSGVIQGGVAEFAPDDAKIVGVALRAEKKIVDKIVKGARMHA